MLKFGMTLKDGHGVGLVLEPRNLQLLTEGRPMIIDLADVGLTLVKRKKGKGKILLAHAVDPVVLMEQMMDLHGIPRPTREQAIYGAAEVHPEHGRCYCRLLGSGCPSCD